MSTMTAPVAPVSLDDIRTQVEQLDTHVDTQGNYYNYLNLFQNLFGASLQNTTLLSTLSTFSVGSALHLSQSNFISNMTLFTNQLQEGLADVQRQLQHYCAGQTKFCSEITNISNSFCEKYSLSKDIDILYKELAYLHGNACDLPPERKQQLDLIKVLPGVRDEIVPIFDKVAAKYMFLLPINVKVTALTSTQSAFELVLNTVNMLSPQNLFSY